MSVTLTIILAEICSVLVVVLLVIGGRALHRRRREQAAVNTLVTSIKENQSTRVEKLVGMLKDSGQLNDEDALGKANELIKKQNKFYQDAIDLYFTRNHEVLSKLDSRIEDLLSQYQVLVTVTDGEAPTVDSGAIEQLSKDIAALSKELENLRSENAKLTSQLKAAEHELDQLGQEYVSAFNKPKVSKPKTEDTTPDDVSQEVDDAGVNETVGEARAALGEQEAATEPIAEQTANADAPTANQEQSNEEAVDSEALSAADDSEDSGMLNDLDLAELIGDQPAQPGTDAKAADKD
jgi:polyhydroxyalkanoate synthesis regulator phasin